MLSYTSAVTIALDATPLTVSTGGVGRYTLELARALAAEYPEDQYWLLSDQTFQAQHVPANLHTGGGPRNPAERKWWLWGLEQEMRRRGVDLFHGTDYSVPYVPLRPSVMTVHDLSPWVNPSDPAWQPEASRVRRRTPRLLRMGLATMVITPTETVRRAAIEQFALQPDRVVAIPLAATEMFRPVPPVKNDVPYFLFVGTSDPRKNIARLIDAWREVRKTIAVDLVLAGRNHGPTEEPGLRVIGEVPDSELPGLYSGALASVYPSLYEGFGLPVLEAMQCGALVITSRDPAILEVSGDGAVHVDGEDTTALAEAMRAAATNPNRFDDIRQRALARAAQFSWRKTARLTREVYGEAGHIFHKA
jgi:glycosyltransferase involved in cell wall biosynthesis